MIIKYDKFRSHSPSDKNSYNTEVSDFKTTPNPIQFNSNMTFSTSNEKIGGNSQTEAPTKFDEIKTTPTTTKTEKNNEKNPNAVGNNSVDKNEQTTSENSNKNPSKLQNDAEKLSDKEKPPPDSIFNSSKSSTSKPEISIQKLTASTSNIKSVTPSFSQKPSLTTAKTTKKTTLTMATAFDETTTIISTKGMENATEIKNTGSKLNFCFRHAIYALINEYL